MCNCAYCVAPSRSPINFSLCVHTWRSLTLFNWNVLGAPGTASPNILLLIKKLHLPLEVKINYYKICSWIIWIEKRLWRVDPVMSPDFGPQATLPSHWKALESTEKHWKALQSTEKHCNKLQCIAKHCKALHPIVFNCTVHEIFNPFLI